MNSIGMNPGLSGVRIRPDRRLYITIMEIVMKKLPLTLILTIAFSGVLTAQESWTDRITEEMTPLQKELLDQVGTTAVDYWNPRLNKYRNTVDRALSPEDLATLNQMRVRFAILIEELSDDMEESMGREDDSDEMSFESEEGRGVIELMEIWTQTVALAEKYEEQLAPLGDRVFTDISVFGEELAVDVDEFTAAHSEELSGDEKGKELLASRETIVTKLREAEAVREDFQHVYGFVVEPLIMLFNGGDLRDMIPGFAGSSTSSAQAVAGLLPASTTLAQNYPNPAATTTTVPLQLDGPVSDATLRIFSADGVEVKSIPLDPMEAGDHAVEVNVADLEQGTYLYQLSIGSGENRQLHAKVMHVVR